MDGLNRSLQEQKAGVSGSVDGVREEIQNLSVKLRRHQYPDLGTPAEDRRELSSRSNRCAHFPLQPLGEIEPDQAYSAAYNDFLAMGNYDLAIADVFRIS